MDAIKFDEENDVLKCPEGGNCSDLPIHRASFYIVSCWEPTEEELEEIIRNRKVYLYVLGGTHPPVNITGKREEIFMAE